MKNKISVSMMCADFMNLKPTIEVFEKYGIDYLHMDIMDGHFVPNFTLGTDFCKIIRENTKIPLDIHLMIEHPESKLDWFDLREGDFVSVHVESTNHLQRVLSAIKSKGAKAMAAINPATSLDTLKYILSDIDGVLIMTVNPGFAGQRLVKATLEKITELRKYLDSNGYQHIEIEVDGNVSYSNAKLMKEAGANIFVAGTSSIFGTDTDLESEIIKLKDVLDI